MKNSFIFLGYKIPNISSLKFANLVKNALNKEGYEIERIGFLGTLDPFARGQMIMATNHYTRLLNHINTDYKTYRATLFLGLESRSLDTENIVGFNETSKILESKIKDSIESIKGSVKYSAPLFSAKNIQGKRAYKLARAGANFETKEVISDIKYMKFISYNHPFITFEIEISKGGYVRSIGQILCDLIGVKGSLCYLERIKEGEFCYKKILRNKSDGLDLHLDSKIESSIIESKIKHNNSTQNIKLISLDIKNAISYDIISLLNHAKDSINGAKIRLDSKEIRDIFNERSADSGVFLADFGCHYGIIEASKSGEVKYILNRIEKC